MPKPDLQIRVAFLVAALSWAAFNSGHGQTFAPSPSSSTSLEQIYSSNNSSGVKRTLVVKPRTETPNYNAGVSRTLKVTSSETAAPAPPPQLPRVFAPTRPRTAYTRYPWKYGIVATVFWVGEKPGGNNPTPNDKSSWDPQWAENFGGLDDPNPDGRAWDFRPKSFVPGQNPFYIALPYNDIQAGVGTKPEAKVVIPWFEDEFERSGRTVLKGRWLAIRCGAKTCYAQWEDCGPFETNDWRYVFGDARPKTPHNNGVGLDVSPAVRDFLGLASGQRCDWRFVDVEEVPEGPWRKYGDNNHFVQMRRQKTENQSIEEIVRLQELRDAYLRGEEAATATTVPADGDS